ncbi:MAG: glycyl radical protein [Pontiellaceae bacterium]|nr:glycyl radical protein [Pontiellaceae bacterium]MBN2783524.1 glycyl radical protein [Pontiellaceae bacterium]
MNKRVEKLRKDSLEAVPHISMERARLETEVYRQYGDSLPIPVLRARVFEKIMAEKTISIADGELIVGERGECAGAVPTFPELCCHTMEDLDIMNRRDKIFYKVSSEDARFHETEVIPFWEKRALRNQIVSSMTEEWRDCYKAGIFTEFMEQRGPGHTVADDKIYRKGFRDFQQDILDAMNTIGSDPDRKAELEAMMITSEAIINLGRRYAELADKMAIDEVDSIRKAELESIAEVCRRVPAEKPQTFHEALQMYWFVHVGVITEMNNWDAFNPGRLDQHLNPFYQAEVAAGLLDAAKAKELLQCLWVKFNNHPAPPKVGVTLKESGTYTDFANINSGGLTVDGEDGVNDVTWLVLDVIDEMRLLQPSSNVQVSRKNPDEFVKRASEIVRKGWGQPSFFNADAVVEEMVRMGKTLKDARCGGTSGCVETGAFGKESYILTGYFNLPKVLEITLNNGIDPMSGQKLGIDAPFSTYEELFDAFRKQLHHFIEIKVTGNNTIEKLYMEQMPVPFLSTIISDCIRNGKDYNAGGARYNTMYIQGVGIGTMTDSLCAIRKHVFEDKTASMPELMEALSKDFEGHELLRGKLFNQSPKYGNDDDEADVVMRSVFDAFHAEVSGRPSMKGGKYAINMLPTTCHVYFGSVIGATPCGRKARMPLPEGISPSKGADRKGPTAVIQSAAKMGHIDTGGTLLNQKFTPQVMAGQRGIDNMSALVRAYFRMDGHHIQFNVVDKQTLLDAQKKPEEYSDLIVRVAGYSDYFNNLDKVLQDEIIARTEQDFS